MISTFRNTLLLSCLSLFWLTSCSVQSPINRSKSQVAIQRMIDTSAVFSKSFTGLVVEDISTHQKLAEIHPHHHFVPASNTKIYTLFACLSTLTDSLPTLRYIEKSDSLFFWGTADPTFLHPRFSQNQTLNFLKNHAAKHLVFATGNFQNEALGNGWMWDDYNDDYQTELTPLPMYANVVRFEMKNNVASISPTIFQNTFFFTPNEKADVKRVPTDNQFFINKSLLEKQDYLQEIPIKTSFTLTQQLLIDTLKRNVLLSKLPLPKEAKTLYGLPVDTVYRRMMYVSDNMLAEHLLLAAGTALSDTMKSKLTIQKIVDKYLSDLPDKTTWVDGSGLSRYNSFTPSNTVDVLKKLYTLAPQDRIFELMPASGRKGTLNTMFVGEKPYIFAKSGSMSGVYNLSGYLVTKQNKVLVFSFMNNNFDCTVSQARKEVEKVLKQIHELY